MVNRRNMSVIIGTIICIIAEAQKEPKGTQILLIGIIVLLIQSKLFDDNNNDK